MANIKLISQNSSDMRLSHDSQIVHIGLPLYEASGFDKLLQPKILRLQLGKTHLCSISFEVDVKRRSCSVHFGGFELQMSVLQIVHHL